MGLESISEESLRDCRKGFNSPADYVRMIERLHADRALRAAMSQAARLRALEFTWTAYRRRVAMQLDAWLRA